MKKDKNSEATLERGFIARILFYYTHNEGGEYGGKILQRRSFRSYLCFGK
jgi:hypothetical protein